MSVLIKGMEMPMNCSVCKLAQHHLFSGSIMCPLLGCCVAYYDEGIHYEEHDCPLVKIPTPHGELIDRCKIGLTNFECFMFAGDFREAFLAYIDKVENAPTIIEAEGGEQNGRTE